MQVSSSENETDNVFGRYVGDGTEQGETREPSSSDNIPSRAVEFCSQQGEVATDPYPSNPLPWFHCGLEGDEDQVIRGEGDTNLNGLQENQEEGMCICERIGQADWQDDSNSPCCFPSTTVVPRAPTPEEPDLPEVSIVRVYGDTEPGGPPGARLVVSGEESNEREECNNTGPRPHHGDRCLNAGLGSSLPGHTDRRTLVSGGTKEPYKLSGTPCSPGLE